MSAVSVAVVTYNHAAFIEETVRSAVAQVPTPLEIIVADDGSTDGSRDVIERLAHEFPGLVIPAFDEHRGFATTFNRALLGAKGKFIALLGGDDLFLPGKLKAQADWLEQDPRRVLCGHDAIIFQSETGKDTRHFSDLSRWPKEGTGPTDFVVGGSPYLPSAVMLRRSAIPPGGFDERIKTVIEEKLFIELLVGGNKYGHVDGIYARYRRHSRNTTSLQKAQVLSDLFMILGMVEAQYPELAHHCRRGRARLHLRNGLMELREGRATSARSYLRRALGTAPDYSWKVPIWYALSYAPHDATHKLMSWLTQRAVGLGR